MSHFHCKQTWLDLNSNLWMISWLLYPYATSFGQQLKLFPATCFERAPRHGDSQVFVVIIGAWMVGLVSETEGKLARLIWAIDIQRFCPAFWKAKSKCFICLLHAHKGTHAHTHAHTHTHTHTPTHTHRYMCVCVMFLSMIDSVLN